MTDTALMTMPVFVVAPDAAILPYSESAMRYARKSKADRTLKLYGAAWREFQAFAEDHGATALPATPGTVIEYLTALADAGAKVSTIGVKLAGIAYRHRLQHYADPTTGEDVRIVMAGIRRELGTAPNKKAAITLDDLRRIVAALPDTLAGKRDRAMLLIGWAGAFRRSELVGLDVADLHVNGAIKITLRKSKTDQEGRGMIKMIPPVDDEAIDPVRALKAWIAKSGIKSGPLFRRIDRHGVMHGRLSDKAVALIIKDAAQRAGLEPVQFAGHSLRSGFITAAALAGVEDRDIAAQSGHKSMTVLHGYIQDAGATQMRAAQAVFGENV
jgi:integrase